eukprot:TRINITY_DN17171_c0_g1_i1.p2 TRINITY_DN17171_c0_g1~~TRINITY_DN17171_c0_g1_i1.p2  ORF type:complete len:124 (-),score=5.03 TRINITY_DN17171_c0_g1_i1:35-406(-)
MLRRIIFYVSVSQLLVNIHLQPKSWRYLVQKFIFCYCLKLVFAIRNYFGYNSLRMQYVLLGVLICNCFHAVKTREACSTLLNPPPPPINDITTAPVGEDFISDLPGPIKVGSDDCLPACNLFR